MLSRRGFLAGGACLACCGARAGDESLSASPGCDDVEAYPAVELKPGEAELHNVFLLLAMALVFDGWSIDRTRPHAVEDFAAVEPGRSFPDYLGYNIGAVIVDERHEVVSFGLNRNLDLNSTLEHAEARAVRNAIRLANAARPSQDAPRWTFSNLLRGRRIYTTLAPCAQCAGILDLANFRDVVFAQEDPGQFHIAAVLYNLQKRATGRDAPTPLRAEFFPYWDRLAASFAAFMTSSSVKRAPAGATAFLQSVAAYAIFREAAQGFEAYEPADADARDALRKARDFRARSGPWIVAGVGPL